VIVGDVRSDPDDDHTRETRDVRSELIVPL
jgi:hypothetical protein